MCMFCAAIPTAAAAGMALDHQQRKSRQEKGLPPQRLRPLAALTALLLFALGLSSVIFHSKFPHLG